MLFYIRNLSILGFWHPQGTLETFPLDSKGWVYFYPMLVWKQGQRNRDWRALLGLPNSCSYSNSVYARQKSLKNRSFSQKRSGDCWQRVELYEHTQQWELFSSAPADKQANYIHRVGDLCFQGSRAGSFLQVMQFLFFIHAMSFGESDKEVEVSVDCWRSEFFIQR